MPPPAPGRDAPLDVALAVVRRRGAVLLQRRAREPFMGRWELPGGKVAPGEAPDAAVRREVREELGLEPLAAEPLGVHEHAYPGGPRVRLHAFAVDVGPLPVACGTERRWVSLRAWRRYDVLEGTRPILAALEQGEGPQRPGTSDS